jgi:hypothetical protein
VLAYEADRPANLLFQIDALSDGWFHGFDNIQCRVGVTNDSAKVLDYYLRDCSSWTDPPTDRKEILKPADLRVEFLISPDLSGRPDTSSRRFDSARALPLSLRYKMTVRIPRGDTYGFTLQPGKTIAIRIGLQTAADRWVWDEMFERNYMMPVQLQ